MKTLVFVIFWEPSKVVHRRLFSPLTTLLGENFLRDFRRGSDNPPQSRFRLLGYVLALASGLFKTRVENSEI